MTDGDDARHIRGRVPTSEAWIPVRDLNNDGAQALGQGRVDEGVRMLREAISLTEGSTQIEARDLRARALLNLSGAHDYRAELTEALRLVDESLAINAGIIDEAGDARGTRTVVANAMVSRTQILVQSDRFEEAGAQIDEALALLDAHDDIGQAELMRFQAHNVRASLLLLTGRMQDAEAEARRALDLAARVDPTLAAHPYLTLGAIAQHTGDMAAAQEFIALAGTVQDPAGSIVTRQITMENRARSAMRQGDHAQADDLFRQAVALAREGDLVTREIASRMGVAANYLQTGNPVLAAKVLRMLIADLGTDGAVHDRREAYGFLGDAESKRGKFVLADEAYLAARELSRSAHERCRVDLRRAEMQAEWASFTPLPGKRTQRLQRGLDLAIPVLLATEALRADFAPGPIRERWSLQVSAPARELAFRLAVTLGDGEVLFALIENAAASATLHTEALEAQAAETTEAAETTPDAAPFAPVAEMLPASAPESGALLPAAASGFITEATALPYRFAAPPRVMPIPGTAPALEKWIGIAEAEYGVTVRSETVVAAW
ncbi:tetratricopeptide (TPR) repeat protein [Microbacterium sp. W4I4]|uniref:hypothetical protein n=1 Tax=Microbacterium sp. W4I4 TaxID=3042295 RepID=UPI00278AB2BD|nr:hypothetical protein [Microbacterium sp. W4I4]MDQ0615473.1 tetratricopeptide (TPR) repeat protein [Microbacterium sp. W4I4]